MTVTIAMICRPDVKLTFQNITNIKFFSAFGADRPTHIIMFGNSKINTYDLSIWKVEEINEEQKGKRK